MEHIFQLTKDARGFQLSVSWVTLSPDLCLSYYPVKRAGRAARVTLSCNVRVKIRKMSYVAQSGHMSLRKCCAKEQTETHATFRCDARLNIRKSLT